MMDDDDTRIEIFGRVATGYKAKFLIILFMVCLMWEGFGWGYAVGKIHACTSISEN